MTDTAQKFSNLFRTGKIGNVTLANRAIVAPMTRTSATVDGLVTDEMVDHYGAFARGGWGMVFTEATYTDKEYSQGYINQPGIADDEQARSWSGVVDVFRQHGVPVFMQLIHAGAVNQGNHWKDGSVAPSAIRPINEQIDRYNGSGPFQVPKEISKSEIKKTIMDFADAAMRAVDLGFHGVEIHGANGYLPDQFLTTYTNSRTDAYGGSLENRFRYHMELVAEVRARVPSEIPVGVRISQTKVNDLTYSWPGGAEDAAYVFSKLGEIDGLFIHIAAHLGCAPVFGTERSLAGLARQHSGHVVIANGKLHDPEEAERVLAQEEADFVSIAKGALADPNWPQKILSGEPPIAFDPGMITPLATLSNTRSWRQAQAGP